MNIVKGVDEELCQEYKACLDEEFLRVYSTYKGLGVWTYSYSVLVYYTGPKD
jgi:hypothetical protein